MHTHINIQYLGTSCDHLGNVRAVVGDRKLWMSSSPGEYRAQVWSVSNYYPFGMAQPGRNWNDASGDYRYGYNGKEEDNEIKANNTENGKSLDYGARWYDPRKARWDAVDPLEAKYPSLSPYSAFNDNPIFFNDPNGKSGLATIDRVNKVITITSNLVFYGETNREAATESAKLIEKYWNDANGTIVINRIEYKVKFTINGTYQPEVTSEEVKENNDITKNYIYVCSTCSNVSEFSMMGNTGRFLASEMLTSTAAHEYGHGLGLDHPERWMTMGLVDALDFVPIMVPQKSAVSARFTLDPSLGNSEVFESLQLVCNPVNPALRRVSKAEVSAIQVPNLLSVDRQDVGVLKNIYYPIQNSNSTNKRGGQDDTNTQQNSAQKSNP